MNILLTTKVDIKMKEIWRFLDHTRWPRNALETHNYDSWNEMFSDLQEYEAHLSKKTKILCITVHSDANYLYNRTEKG
jgi:hypothetical protein